MKKFLALLLAMALLTSGCAAFAEDTEDGQNPVMNLIGLYQDRTSGRATMSIECKGQDEAVVTIDWADSASVNVEWVMSGKFDTEANIIEYDNCVKTVQMFDEIGKETDEVMAENGTGRFIVNEDWTISWQDDMADEDRGCVFEFVCPPLNAGGPNDIKGFYVDSTGNYGCIDIEAAEEDPDGKCCSVSISIFYDDDVSGLWCFDGSYDSETGLLEYETCERCVIYIDADGKGGSGQLADGGSGRLRWNADGTLVWEDDYADMGYDLIFEPEEEPEAEQLYEEP